jgi:hypothetical protein
MSAAALPTIAHSHRLDEPNRNHLQWGTASHATCEARVAASGCQHDLATLPPPLSLTKSPAKGASGHDAHSAGSRAVLRSAPGLR